MAEDKAVPGTNLAHISRRHAEASPPIVQLGKVNTVHVQVQQNERGTRRVRERAFPAEESGRFDVVAGDAQCGGSVPSVERFFHHEHVGESSSTRRTSTASVASIALPSGRAAVETCKRESLISLKIDMRYRMFVGEWSGSSRVVFEIGEVGREAAATARDVVRLR